MVLWYCSCANRAISRAEVVALIHAASSTQHFFLWSSLVFLCGSASAAFHRRRAARTRRICRGSRIAGIARSRQDASHPIAERGTPDTGAAPAAAQARQADWMRANKARCPYLLTV